MARREFNPGALTAPLPAVLVSVGNADEYNLITIGWTGILSTHPPRTYISVRPERHSYGMLKESREFVINLTTAEMVRAVDFAGVFTGKKVDKLKECGLTAVKSKTVAPPTVIESPLALECRVVEIIPMGTHDVFIADIVGITADEGIIDEKGRICFDRANLLAYAHGEYFALGEKLGAFGFSASKSAKRTDKRAPVERRAPTERSAPKSRGSKSGKGAKTVSKKKKTPPVSRKKQKRGE